MFNFRDKFEKTKIPTLDETIVQLLAHQQKMFIDIKYNNNKMVETILKAFKTHSQLYSNAVVSSFFPNLIYAVSCFRQYNFSKAINACIFQ